jgi:hypothetical protein
VTSDTRKIVIPGRAIGWQQFYRGKHWAVRAAVAQQIHGLVRAALDPEQPMFTGQIAVTVTAQFVHHLMDADNICSKVFIDGIKGWWVPDDTPGWIRSVTTISEEGTVDQVIIEATQVSDPFPWVCACCDVRWPSERLYKKHIKEGAQ